MNMLITTLVFASMLQSGPIEVTDDNWAKLRDQIIAKGPELGFREVKWQSNHWLGPNDAIRKAAPMLLWASNGHPLGLTSSYGINSRLTVWGDPSLQVQAGFFAPVADDTNRMAGASNWIPQSLKDKLRAPGGEGAYVLAPGGVILGQTSSTDPTTVSRMLDDALAKWSQLPAGSRSWAKDREVGDKTNPFKPLNTPPVATNPRAQRGGQGNSSVTGAKSELAVIVEAPTQRGGVNKREDTEKKDPATVKQGGAATTTGTNQTGGVKPAPPNAATTPTAVVAKLKMTIRDLPREGQSQRTYNHLFFNLTDRLGPLISTEAKPNATVNWPKKLVQSLAANAFIDSVKGMPMSFSESDVQTARITSVISNITGDIYTLRIVGNTNATTTGYWSLEPGKEANANEQQVRGMDLQWLGRAKFNAKTKQFISLEMVGAGQRWGGTPLNGRLGDTRQQPIGLYLTLASTSWYDQLEPSSVESERKW